MTTVARPMAFRQPDSRKCKQIAITDSHEKPESDAFVRFISIHNLVKKIGATSEDIGKLNREAKNGNKQGFEKALIDIFCKQKGNPGENITVDFTLLDFTVYGKVFFLPCFASETKFLKCTGSLYTVTNLSSLRHETSCLASSSLMSATSCTSKAYTQIHFCVQELKHVLFAHHVEEVNTFNFIPPPDS